MSENTEYIKNEIFARRPVLREIYEQFGDFNLHDYARSWQVPAFLPDPVFLEVLEKVAIRIYGEVTAKSILKQLTVRPLVSTIDHLGISGHPIFLNSDLFFSFAFPQNEVCVVLATESVSLNNTSSWSGSLLFHEGEKLRRVSLFRDKWKTRPVFSMPAYTPGDLNSTLSRLPTNLKFQAASLLEKFYNQANFSHQSSALTSDLWQRTFPSAPRVFHLPLETIVAEYLTQVLSRPGHVLGEFLQQESRNADSPLFGQAGMFWGIDNSLRRQKVGMTQINLDNASPLLSQRKIYPNSPLCFVCLLWTGFTCAGGFTQTTWLTKVARSFSDQLRASGRQAEAERIASIPTKYFSESFLTQTLPVAGSLQPTLWDMCVVGEDLYSSAVASAAELTLAESLAASFPTIYSVIVPPSQQKVL